MDLPWPSLVRKRDRDRVVRYADDDAFEVNGMVAERESAVRDASKAKQWAMPSCDERSEGTDGATGTRRLQRKRSEAMSDAVM